MPQKYLVIWKATFNSNEIKMTKYVNTILEEFTYKSLGKSKKRAMCQMCDRIKLFMRDHKIDLSKNDDPKFLKELIKKHCDFQIHEIRAIHVPKKTKHSNFCNNLKISIMTTATLFATCYLMYIFT